MKMPHATAFIQTVPNPNFYEKFYDSKTIVDVKLASLIVVGTVKCVFLCSKALLFDYI
jgi:hypothetical protein